MSAPAASWPRAVVFDLDGTLIDSAGDIADVLNECLGEHGIQPFDEPSVIPMIGGGAKLLVERAFDKLGRRHEQALLDEIFDKFAKRYEALGAGRSQPFPGVPFQLMRLKAAGVPMGICTNKPEAITHRVLDQLNLTPWFDCVIGESPRLARKPAPDMLLACLDGLRTKPADAVMIGDSIADIGTAKAAGVKSIAVTFGYTTIPPRELGADAVIEHFSELPEALEKLGGNGV